MFEPFHKFVKKAANTYGISKEVEAATVCESFRKLIPDLFPKATDEISPAFYRNRTLTISVDSPTWSQEVIMRKDRIIEKMNEKAGKQVIKDLRTLLRNS